MVTVGAGTSNSVFEVSAGTSRFILEVIASNDVSHMEYGRSNHFVRKKHIDAAARSRF